MKRRIIAGGVAAVLALLGGFLLLQYVGAADARAVEGMQPVQVLVVSKPIPKGTSAERLAAMTATKEVPQAAVVPGGVVSLAQVAGQVTNADLAVGEQLLSSRFDDPGTLGPQAVQVPKGLQRITIGLEPQRVVGGEIKAGDTVGVFISTGSSGATTIGKGESKTTVGTTHLTAHKVLVTKIADGKTNEATEGTTDRFFVTMAVLPGLAERIVWATEYGKVYLSLEPADARTDGTSMINPENVYR